jgi:hypothetical protein
MGTAHRAVRGALRARAGRLRGVLALCADAGLATVGVIAVDGTKVHANAGRDRSRSYEDIARAMVEEVVATDTAETAAFGDRRGDERPELVTRREGRERWLRDARQRLDQRRAIDPKPVPRSRLKRLREAKRRREEELNRRARRQRPLRGLSRARGDEERAALRLATEALHATDHAHGQDQPHRPGRKAGARHARVGAGLQRPGGVQ